MLNLNDVDSIEVKSFCKGPGPCHHDAMIILKDKTYVTGIHSDDICVLVHSLALEKINPGHTWSPREVKKHFAYEINEGSESANQVLNRIFIQKKPSKSCIFL